MLQRDIWVAFWLHIVQKQDTKEIAAKKGKSIGLPLSQKRERDIEGYWRNYASLIGKLFVRKSSQVNFAGRRLHISPREKREKVLSFSPLSFPFLSRFPTPLTPLLCTGNSLSSTGKADSPISFHNYIVEHVFAFPFTEQWICTCYT